MPNRRASCNYGQLQVVCEGEPVRISMCHLDLDELDIELAHLGRLPSTQIGAQEITSFAPPYYSLFCAS